MPAGLSTLQFLRLDRPPRNDVPLLVFLPGMDGTGELFYAQIGELERCFEVRCVMIPANDLTRWPELADQIAELIEAELNEQSERPVYLCGESFGGCLAMYVVLRSPHLIDRVVLINPASSFHRRLWMAWGSNIVRLIPEGLYHLSCAVLLPFLANLERIAFDNSRTLLRAMKSVSQESSLWRLSLLRDFNLSDTDLSTITQPTLIIASGGDHLLPSVSEAERLQSLMPKAQTYLLPHSGHACLLETGINLYQIMEQAQFMGDHPMTVSSTLPSARLRC